MSRNTDLFQQDGQLRRARRQRLERLLRVHQRAGATSPQLIGDGTIDGQGGEPVHRQGLLLVAGVVRAARGERQHRPAQHDQPGEGDEGLHPLPASRCTTSAKFHVKLTSSPPEGAVPGVCDTDGGPGQGLHRLGHHAAHALEVVQQRGLSADAQLGAQHRRRRSGDDRHRLLRHHRVQHDQHGRRPDRDQGRPLGREPEHRPHGASAPATACRSAARPTAAH